MAKASHKDGSDQDLLLWICLIAIEAMISHAIIINTNSWINMEDRIKITVSNSNPINFLFWPNLPMALRNLCSCTIVALWVRNTAAWKSLDNQHIVSVSSWQRSYNIGWAAYTAEIWATDTQRQDTIRCLTITRCVHIRGIVENVLNWLVIEARYYSNVLLLEYRHYLM